MKPVKATKPKPQPQSTYAVKPQSTYDPTINIEILETLKLLGNEITRKRERKEQKQLINQVIDKRMRRQPSQLIPKSQPVEEYEYYSDEPEQPQPFKSRIRR